MDIEILSLSQLKTYLEGLEMFCVCLRPVLEGIKMTNCTVRSVPVTIRIRLYFSLNKYIGKRTEMKS